MTAPETLEEAQAMLRQEKAKFTGALSAVAGSRWLTAIAASLALAFGITLLYAPDRLPHLSGVSLTTFGLPDNLDFGLIGDQIVEAGTAAIEQGGKEEAASFLTDHADWVTGLNAGGFGLALTVLLGNLWVMTKRRRTTRG